MKKNVLRVFLGGVLCGAMIANSSVHGFCMDEEFLLDEELLTEEALEEEALIEESEESEEEILIDEGAQEEEPEDMDFQSEGATSGSCGSTASDDVNWKYDTSTRTLTITGKGAIKDYETKWDTPWYYWKDSIKRIVIGEGITRIGAGNFIDVSLEFKNDNVFNIPSTVKSIGKRAFQGVSFYKDVVIPENVTSIEEYAFYSAKIYSGNLKINANMKTITGGAFYEVYANEIFFSDHLVEIGDRAFYGCKNMSKFSFPKSVKKIGKEAFCKAKVRRVEFNGDAPEVGENAFGEIRASVYYLKSNKTWTEAKKEAVAKSFQGVGWHYLGEKISDKCGDKATWSIDENGHFVVEGTGPMWDYSEENVVPWHEEDIKSVTFGEGITRVGAYSFYKLAERRWPNEVKFDPFPKSLTEFGSHCFFDIGTIPGLVIPENTTYIGYGAFSVMDTDADVVEIPKNVQYIGDYAFYGFNCGKEIRLNGFTKLTYLGSSAFVMEDPKYDTPIRGKMTFPKTLTHIGRCALMGAEVKGTLDLPENLQELGFYAFKNCSNLTGDVVIPKGIDHIRIQMFYNTGISSVTFGEQVLRVAEGAFNDCSKLKKVTFLGRKPQVDDDVRIQVFDGCPKGIEVYYNAGDRSWKDVKAEDIGMKDLEPVFHPVYPDRECTVKFVQIKNGKKKLDIPTQKVKCGEKATKPDLTALKLGEKQSISFSYYYTSDGSAKKAMEFDFDKTIVIEDITIIGTVEGGSNPEAKKWGDVPVAVRKYMKFTSPEDIPDGIWFIGSNKYNNKWFYYTGKAQKPDTFLVFDGNKKLTSGKHYKLSYANNVKPGKATITITFKGKYADVKEQYYDFYINEVILHNVQISKQVYYYEYDGKVHKPKPTITAELNGKTIVLKEGKHFIFDYDTTDEFGDFTNVGESRIYIRSAEGYTNVFNYIRVVIDNKTLISKAKVGKVKAQVYNGHWIEPDVKVTYKGEELVKERDYFVLCIDSDAGKACMGIYGRGERFFGETFVTFQINPLDISKSDSKVTAKLSQTSFTYSKDGVKPSPTVEFVNVKGKKKTLVEGKDYTVSYKNFKKKGDATLTITGKGNFKGKIKLKYTIK
ncbi:leucine-rich repeat domain-containing protein [Butyrivibrio sp. MC2021]|uniref:leucine-rich repeat domain-containing protein n=1 Tax=Butyrivibrio sp. MC2021 TaxID=1408306 RepID=UPI000479DE84|nr:leucine-rich repeat domain-containing protein [Butyrivibrio sp. MC2021]